MIDGGYVQAVVILVINLAVVAAGAGGALVGIKALAVRVEHIEQRVDKILELMIGRNQ